METASLYNFVKELQTLYWKTFDELFRKDEQLLWESWTVFYSKIFLFGKIV